MIPNKRIVGAFLFAGAFAALAGPNGPPLPLVLGPRASPPLS